ncbi:hypothetical protein M3Y94_01076700 [Aphelenchoides besseyi]|nr:hypothetical protein M3Y94_01076700 [Aphelenchoides besseyi]
MGANLKKTLDDDQGKQTKVAAFILLRGLVFGKINIVDFTPRTTGFNPHTIDKVKLAAIRRKADLDPEAEHHIIEMRELAAIGDEASFEKAQLLLRRLFDQATVDDKEANESPSSSPAKKEPNG